jgi:hypothetical protein
MGSNNLAMFLQNTYVLNSNVTLQNLLIDFNGTSAGYALNNAYMGTNTAVYNCKFWDCGNTTYGTIYQNLSNSDRPQRYENNTFYNCYYGINASSVGQKFYAKNNMVLSPQAGGKCFRNVSGATGNNNLSTDDTADDFGTTTGAVINATAGNEVKSTGDTSADFLVPKPDATNAAAGGTTPAISENTAGIEGNARPSVQGKYSIGAGQVSGANLYYYMLNN